MRLLIHTIRALHYVQQHGHAQVPEDVVPASRLREVQRQLVDLEILPEDDRYSNGVPPFVVQPRAEGRVDMIVKQYPVQEAGWRLLEALKPHQSWTDVVETVINQDVYGTVLTREVVLEAATALADYGLVESKRTADRLHARLKITSAGRQRLSNERIPFDVDFDGRDDVPQGIVNNYENNSLNNYGNMGAGAVGSNAEAYGQLVVNGADVATVIAELREAIREAGLAPERTAALVENVDTLEAMADADVPFVLRLLQRLRTSVIDALGEDAADGIVSKIGLLWSMFGGQLQQ